MNPESASRIASAKILLESQKHPLDPLTAAEIIQTASLIKTQGPGNGVHFKAIGIIGPPKSELRSFLSAERGGLKPTPLPRRASALFYHRGTSDLFLAVVDLSLNRIDKVERLESRVHAQADIDEAIMMRDICLQHPKILEAIKKFKIPADLTVVCDTWPYGRDHGEEFPRSIQVTPSLSFGFFANTDKGVVLPLRPKRASGIKSLRYPTSNFSSF